MAEGLATVESIIEVLEKGGAHGDLWREFLGKATYAGGWDDRLEYRKPLAALFEDLERVSEQVPGYSITDLFLLVLELCGQLGRERVQFFADALQRSSQPFLAARPDGKILSCNPAFCQLTGYTEAELNAMTWMTDLTSPEWHQVVRKALLELVISGKPQRFESEYTRKDGIRVPVESFVHDIRDDQGRVVYSFAFVTDITERKRIEAELFREKERLGVTLSSIGDAVIAVDMAGRINLFNSTAETLTGLSRAEATGRPLEMLSIIDEKTNRPAGELVQKVFVDGQSVRPTNRKAVVSQNGKERFVAYSAAPIRGAGGTAVGAILVLRDETDMRRKERDLLESEARFRLLAENATDVIFRYRLIPPLKFEYVSQAAGHVFGYGPDEFYADPRLCLKIVHPMDRDALIRMVAGRVDFNKPLTLRWLHKEGRILWTEQRITPVRNPRGQLEALEGIARDVTERKKMEEQLEYLSLHDPLTGFYNRVYFEEEMRRLEGGRDYPVAIISTDVDGLKLINDTMGYKNGNELLREYSRVLKAAFRKSDVIARTGGDEFAIVLPRTDSRTAEVLCQRLEKAVAEYSQAHQNLPLSLSLGFAVTVDRNTSLEAVLAEADRNLRRDKMHRSTSAAHSIVRTLRTALAAKDYVSGGHLARVVEMTGRLGEIVDLPKKDRADLQLLAEVHDLGKVGIPDRILLKEGPLTAEEREEIKQHSVIGYRIAKSSPELSPIADLILHHHEWWNGKGYPSGLKQKEIPIACRIVAIADAYDAMTNDRPYRKAMTPKEAIEELRRCSGTQFDIQLVERFVTVASLD